MNVFSQFRSFRDSECGAVTADFVIMAGFAIGLALGVAVAVGSGSVEHGEAIEASMQSRGVPAF